MTPTSQQNGSCRLVASKVDHIVGMETLRGHIYTGNNDDGSEWHGLVEWHLGSYRLDYSINSDF